jgi:hypothetical protein
MNESAKNLSPSGVKPRTGLGTASLVLGILSLTCFLALTGLPAIITGHIARRRAKKWPAFHGGAGTALAGLIMGYLSVPLTLVCAVALGLALPAMAKFRGRPQGDDCVQNLKEVGLAARIWSNEHNGVFPADFLTMSNELITPKRLVCPQDWKKKRAEDFARFDPAKNVSYEYLAPRAKEADMETQPIFRCPVHGHVTLGDGSVQENSGRR